MKRIIMSILFLVAFQISGIKIDRVILSTNLNKGYSKFWPLAAQLWQKIVGIKPTLAFIAPEGVYIDESLGDVIRFNPIPKIPTSLQAQTIRLLLPILFPDEVCLISDIDLFPLQKDYFISNVKKFPEDSFIVYKSEAYSTANYYPMCFCAGKGSTFYELFVEPFNEILENETNKKLIISKLITHWASLNYGWCTDEQILSQCVNNWKYFQTRCIRLPGRHRNCIGNKTIHSFSVQQLKEYGYVEAFLPKPYNQFQEAINRLFCLCLLYLTH